MRLFIKANYEIRPIIVALQLSVLQQKKQVINLSARAVLQFMEEQPFADVCVCACGRACVRVCKQLPGIQSFHRKISAY